MKGIAKSFCNKYTECFIIFSSFIQVKVRYKCLGVSFILGLFTHAFSRSHSVVSRERMIGKHELQRI
jgi:hypothetical protein